MLGCAQRAGARALCAAPNLLFPEMARNAKMRGFHYYDTRSRAASSRKTLTGKSGLPELAPLLSARSPVNPVSSVSLPSRRVLASVGVYGMNFVDNGCSDAPQTTPQICHGRHDPTNRVQLQEVDAIRPPHTRRTELGHVATGPRSCVRRRHG